MNPSTDSRLTSRFIAGLAVISVAAFVLRCVFFTGLIGSDDLGYIHYAHALAEGTYRPEAHEFALRFGLIVPMAAAERMIGPSVVAYVIPALAASMAMVILAGLLARRLGGCCAGWLAAALVGLAPSNVHGATDIHADVPMAAWLLGALWLLFHRGLLDPAGEGQAMHSVANRFVDRRGGVAAGLCVGAAYLTKLTAFVAIPVFALLALGRPRLRRAFPWLVGTFSAVVATEVLLLAMIAGDPFLHVRAVRGGPHEAAISVLFPSTTLVVNRTFVELPRKLFDPTHPDFPALGGTFLALAAFLFLLGRAPVPGMGLLTRWIVAWLVLLNFWPLRVWPWRPGMQLIPRVLEPATIIATVALALCTSQAAKLPRGSLRRLCFAGVAVIVAGQCGVVVVQHRDAARSRAGAEAAHSFLLARPDAAPVFSDERTIGILRVMDGFRNNERFREFPTGQMDEVRGAYVVVNRLWLDNLREWYGIFPPKPVEAPPATWDKEFTWTQPPRISLRTAIHMGEAAVGRAADEVVVYRIPEVP